MLPCLRLGVSAAVSLFLSVIKMSWWFCPLSVNTLMWFSGATTAGRASSVMSVCHTLAACMGPVTCPGSALARRTGAASSAIKVRVLNTLILKI